MRYESIRSLRGIAAILVVIYHACEYVRVHTFPESTVKFAFGAIGVDLFFVISGFVMMSAIRPQKTKQTNLHDACYFFARRLARIVPMYWLATATLYLIYLAFKSKFQNLVIEPQKFIDSLLFLPVLGKSGNLSPVINQGWTLYHELFFYILVTFLIAINATKRAALILPITLVIIYIAIHWSGTSHEFIVMGSSMNFEFGMGCLLSVLATRPLRMWQTLVLGLTAAGATGIAISLNCSLEQSLIRPMSWGIASTLVIWMALINDAWFIGRLAKLGGQLGDASYSIYLFHGIAFSAAALITQKSGIEQQHHLYIAWLTLSSCIAGVIVYRLVEAPCLRWLTQKISQVQSSKIIPSAEAARK